MIDQNNSVENEQEAETFPLEPRYHPLHKFPRKIYDFFASAKLAMALLIIILACCVSGVTIWRGREANMLIFGAVWFNSILVLLVVNIACCFFGRIWGRRVTVVSFGMILFHLSFVVMLLAIVYNSLFCFRGIMRVTEGETLVNSDPLNYEDNMVKGRFFNFSNLKGETSLVKLHPNYKVAGEDKRVAYEVAVGESNSTKLDFLYVTHKISYRGIDYFNEKEGYSLLIMATDRHGKELYGAHVPLQSFKQGKDSFAYSTGYKVNGVLKKDVVPFPAPPEQPYFALQADYVPSKLKERGGEVQFLLHSLDKDGLPLRDKPLAEGKAAIGAPFVAGEYVLTAKEVRYWVGMLVRYEPGKPLVMTSLWVALAGMIITTVGRMVRGKKN